MNPWPKEMIDEVLKETILETTKECWPRWQNLNDNVYCISLSCKTNTNLYDIS